MQTRISRSMTAFFVAAGLIVLVAACASEKTGREQKEDTADRVSLAKLTAPARATVEKLTAGGTIEKIDKEMEKGKTVYDVEATINGKHMEYTVGTDGALVGTETSINFSELPDAVRTAAGAYFGSATDLSSSKGVEYGQTTYEIEGQKAGKKAAVTFDETGKLVSEER
ncbi:MAG TPA: PepSY domain-containing protein [Verrucomicrobiae bacterium]|nr:PepSY domain-containing protein [Verrucomicrobiae bacterium]